MKKFQFTIRGSKYNVEITNTEGNIIELEVNGTSYKVELDKEVEAVKTPKIVRQEVAPLSKEKKIPKNISSSVSVKSPLPGVILKVLVKEGDSVKEGDALLIMEAMKMENKIQADKTGVIKAIKVKEGDSVLEGDVLVELE